MSIPGIKEYEEFLIWSKAPVTRNGFHDQILFDCGDTDPRPAYPLTAEETRAALKYARFLGKVCEDQMLAKLPADWRER